MNPQLVRLLQEILICSAALAAVVAIGIYVIKKTRPGSANQEATTSQMLAKFRELHSQGQLSDAEFRTIKTALAERLKRELNGNGETG
jgi:uncharacterized membrane protein